MSERVTIADIRRAGFCASGARRLFDAYGHDFRAFVREGIDTETFLATGDAFAERVVAFKQGRR